MSFSPHSRPRRTRHAVSLLAGALLTGTGAAHAQTYSTNIVNPFLTQVAQFTTTTTSSSSTYTRVAIAPGLNAYTGAAGSNPPAASGLGTAVAYNSLNTFNVNANSTYVVNTSATGYDPGTYVQYLYNDTVAAFNPSRSTQHVQYAYYADNTSNSGTYSFTPGALVTKYQVVNAGYYNASDTAAGHHSLGTATTTVSLYNAGSTQAIPDAQQNGTGGDDTPGTITQTLHVTDTQTINSFNSITVAGLNHPYLGDLVISLSHNGVTTFLIDRVGYNGAQGYDQGTSAAFVSGNTYTFAQNGSDLTAAANTAVDSGGQYDNTFPVDGGVYAAQTNSGPDDANSTTSLSSFVGQSVAGDWTLSVSDASYTDTGSFLGFYFNVNGVAAAPEPSAWASLSIGILGLGVLGLRARRVKGRSMQA